MTNHDASEEFSRQDLAQAVKKTTKAKRTKSVIEACTEIVAKKGATRFRGTLVDTFSASAVVNVYNALSDENKAKYSTMDKGDTYSLVKMVDIAFKMHK